MTRYWIGVASREHVMRGVTGGFCQVCHGKQGPLSRMQSGDWIIYYSPTERFGEKEPCRKFTAIGRIMAGEPYQYQMSPDFTPWRMNVAFMHSIEAAIEPLIPVLTCTKNRKNWGFLFMRGLFEISPDDFKLIASAMGVSDEQLSEQ